MTSEEIIVAVHVAGAVAWVGGGTMSTLTHSSVLKSGDEAAIRGYAKVMSRLSPRFFMPASIITLLSGILAVTSQDIGFGEPFVIGGFVLFGVSMAIGMAILGPRSAQLAEQYEQGGFGGDAAVANEKLMALASRIDLVVLWAAVLLMVIRP